MKESVQLVCKIASHQSPVKLTALQKAHLGANDDEIAGTWHTWVPLPLNRIALLQNQDDLAYVDDALNCANDVE